MSLFASFEVLALNQLLHYQQAGLALGGLPRGERAYITLSLAAKSLLAWRICPAPSRLDLR